MISHVGGVGKTDSHTPLWDWKLVQTLWKTTWNFLFSVYVSSSEEATVLLASGYAGESTGDIKT